MVYSSYANKWRAYQFLDPFAAGSFVVTNQNTNTFCRPDCDSHPKVELQLEVKFVDTPAEAVKLGYSACEACDPMSAPKIDVKVLAQTVDAVNASIGFYPPLRSEDGAQSESSSPSSKDEADHYRLVDLACRHLVMAAAQSVLASDAPDADGKKNRRRRGGVLGFKELAAKSKLSAWHFHRVFKNVTCLTPKIYGSKCVEHLTQQRDLQTQASPLSSSANNSSTSLKSYATPMLSVVSLPLPRKRSRDDIEEGVENPQKRPSYGNIFTPKASPLMDGLQKSVSFELPEMAWVAPQANLFNPVPETLFTHVKPINEEFSPEIPSLDTLAPLMPTLTMDPTIPATDNYLDAFDNCFLQNPIEGVEDPVMWQLEPVLADPFTWNMSLEATNFV